MVKVYSMRSLYQNPGFLYVVIYFILFVLRATDAFSQTWRGLYPSWFNVHYDCDILHMIHVHDEINYFCERSLFVLVSLSIDNDLPLQMTSASLLLLVVMVLHKGQQKGRERTNSGVSVSAPGVSGLLKSEILAKVSVFGLVLSTVLKKLQEPTMLKHAGSVARRPR